MSKNQCRVSLASGVVVLSAVAVILGTAASTVLFDKVQTLDLTGQTEHTFSTEYSLWNQTTARVSDMENEENLLPMNISISFMFIVLDSILSVILVNKNLKYEPILLLNERTE